MKCEMCTVYCELLAVNWKLETGDYHGQRTQDEGVGPSVGVESKRALGAEIAGIHARGAKRGGGNCSSALLDSTLAYFARVSATSKEDTFFRD